MKVFLFTVLTVFSLNASAIAFFTDGDVQKALGAEKVIEVTPFRVEKLLQTGSACEQATYSRSSRAFVVQKQNKAYLYVTTEQLYDLQLCGVL